MVREQDGEKDEDVGGEKEAELHLDALSPTSRIYLHLQISWNSYIIRSTLLLDPLYRRRCNVMLNTSTQKQPPISWERTAHLFLQLSGDLLEEGISLESLYLLLQELCNAESPAGNSSGGPMTCFHSWCGCWNRLETNTADSLLLCTLIAQILALTFRDRAGSTQHAYGQAVICEAALCRGEVDPRLPISQPDFRLVSQLLGLIIQNS